MVGIRCAGWWVVGALALGCRFGSTGATASGGMPGDGSSAGDDGAPTSAPGDDGGPGDDGTAGDDGGPTSSGDGDDATVGDGSDTAGTTGIPPLEPAPWWNPAWSRRAELVIDETADGPLPTGYTVLLDKLDTQAWVAAGELRMDHADLRVVRWDGATSTELTRRLQRIDMMVGVQRLWWKTQDEIDGGTKNEYWLYWNNPDADPAPASWVDSMAGTSEVYVAGDDFEEHLTGECPDGWEPCAPQWSVQSLGNGQVLRGYSPPVDLLLADLDPPADVIVHARVRNVSPAACPGLVTHATTTSWVWAGYGCESGDVPVPGVSMQLVDDGSFTTIAGGGSAQGNEWHSIEVGWIGGKVSLFQDGVLVGTGDGSAATSGGVGFSVEANIAGDFDDIYVRRYVDPEPTVELGPEELAP